MYSNEKNNFKEKLFIFPSEKSFTPQKNKVIENNTETNPID